MQTSYYMLTSFQHPGSARTLLLFERHSSSSALIKCSSARRWHWGDGAACSEKRRWGLPCRGRSGEWSSCSTCIHTSSGPFM